MKKLLPVLLCAAMLLCLLPLEARAAAAAWDGTVDISWYDPAQTEYTIDTPAKLAGLAALVNGMADPAAKAIVGDRSYLVSKKADNVMLVGAGGGNVFDTVYTGGVDFAYKTIYLTADLDMGGRKAADGSWTGPNWTPIGGKFPMKPQEASGDCLTLDTRFNGVLDGQGHTIYNLYCDRCAAKGFPYSMAVGVVGFLGGNADYANGGNGEKTEAEFENGWQPAVRNLVLGSGSIYGRRMVGGIVGRVGETSNGVVIENCGNRADVRNTDSKGVGGICGSAWGAGIIRGCYNTGTISTTYTCPAGGILGTNEGMDVYNCYNAGRIDTNGAQYGRGIGGHDTGSYTVAGCWYLTGCDDDPASNGYYKGTSRKISVSVTAADQKTLQSDTVIAALNANGAVFTQDTAGKNGGYPVLWFETQPRTEVCQITQTAAANGTFTVSRTGEAAFGTSVSLTAQPDAGYRLAYFTANGAPILGGYYTLTGDTALAAVFQKVKTATITVPEYDAFYLAAARTGYRLTADGMEYVECEALHTGDTVLEGNVITLQTHSYADAIPADGALEYREGYQFTVSGAEKNADGTYTVTGDGAVVIEAVRATRRKSWLTFADTGWYTGKETAYTLTTAQQLAGLAKLVSEQGVSFAGVTIRLGNDISLASIDGSSGSCTWTAIGPSLQKPFSGTFDGQGHTIFAMEAYNTGSYAALFGCCVDARIEDLTVCGSAAGEARASYAAGLVSYAKGCAIKDINVYVDVTAAGTHAGGVAAYICDDTAMQGCFSHGSVSGKSGVGGIVGLCYSASDTITGCANFGAVTGSGAGAYGTGGIAGRLAGVMTKCANYGAVGDADRYTGGLAGYTTARNKTTILASKNEAAVSSSNTETRAATGAIVGNAQNLIWGGCTAAGGSLPQLGRSGKVSEKTAAETCPDYTAREAPQDADLPESFTVTFLANGETVAVMTGRKGDRSVKAPELLQLAGYTAAWPAFTPTGRDMTITAVYRQNLVSGGRVTKSGTYFIPWLASGEITIAGGLDVTLIGLDSGTDRFDNLTLTVGSGTKLTLQDVRITGDKTLLSLAGKNTLTLLGRNELIGCADASGNACPTVVSSGDLTINGTGSLQLQALVNNAAFLGAEKSKISIEDCTLTLLKSDKLGFDVGAFCANGADVALTNASFSGRTDSDNVAVLSAETVTVTGGTLRVEAEKSVHAVLGCVSLTNCGLYASGHSGNSAKTVSQTTGVEALQTLAQQSGVRTLAASGFADVRAENACLQDVLTCTAAGLMTGTGQGSFSPEKPMTRAMLVTVLWRMAGSPAAQGNGGFTDLRADWYRQAAVWGAQNGIVSGTSRTTFAPDKAVTKEQACALLARFARTRGVQAAADAAPVYVAECSAWAGSDVQSAYALGIVDSYAACLAAPQASATRAELAHMLSDLLQRV